MSKFLVDESTGKEVARFLQGEGYDAVSVIDEMKGEVDESIVESALRDERIIITNDKDFGELIFYSKLPNNGVILLRLKNEHYENKRKVVRDLLKNYAEEELHNNFLVVTESAVRSRHL